MSYFSSGNFWLWNVPTALGIMSSGLFWQTDISWTKEQWHWHGVSFWWRPSKCFAEFQPVFTIFQWPAWAKVAHLKHLPIIPETQSLLQAAVDPNPMSCHPFALLDTTNHPWSPISQCKKLNVKLSHFKLFFWLTLLLRERMHFRSKLHILVSVETVLHHQWSKPAKIRSSR